MDSLDQTSKRSIWTRRVRVGMILGVLVLATLTLGACGKRPGAVDPPASDPKPHELFPRVYPDLSTDPAP